jgi:hypothetical protein
MSWYVNTLIPNVTPLVLMPMANLFSFEDVIDPEAELPKDMGEEEGEPEDELQSQHEDEGEADYAIYADVK